MSNNAAPSERSLANPSADRNLLYTDESINQSINLYLSRAI